MSATLEPKPTDYSRAKGEPDVPQTVPPSEPPIQRVTVVDVNISFDRMLALVMKGTLAVLLISAFFAAIGFMAFLVLGSAMR